MTNYETIDADLENWARANNLRWFTSYHDVEVRVFSLNTDRRDKVQVGVDAPVNGRVTIRVGQNRNGLSRLHRLERFECDVLSLGETLDSALILARRWASDGSR